MKLTFPQNYLDHISSLTEINNHNEARRVLASYIGKRSLLKSYEALIDLHDHLGRMNELHEVRTELDKELFSMAEDMFENHDDVLNCY